ncbi:MAG: biotin synthase BioB [Candidatus Omnitrophica bacterium]|nr:biotin synthase BioB [Candidatus Omnitrophota bacterium]
MDRKYIDRMFKKVLSGRQLDFKEASGLFCLSRKDRFSLFDAANRVRERFRGRGVDLCSLVNAKSGLCSEDCRFCAQSGSSRTKIKRYGLLDIKRILQAAGAARRSGAKRFCVVTSGRRVHDKREFAVILDAISEIKRRYPGLRRDASLGELDEDMARDLKKAGLDRYNHNLETVEALFPKVCTTHSFRDRVRTIKILKRRGIEVCCGGIFGLGETKGQRVEFAFALKELDVDCVPLNFLNPIAGTPFHGNKAVQPLELLEIVAVFRFILPAKQIRVCGGRQQCLRSLQPLMFAAGADSMILGDYLTTKGSAARDDMRMIKDMGLRV